MMRLSLQEAARCVGGTLHGDDRVFEGLSTDSRSVGKDELFVAIRGPSFDGRDYVPAAMLRGACGALVESPVEGVPCIRVADSRAALLPLAGAWRDRFEIDTVAVTGSNGKTTVKEMIAAILAQDAPVLATRGNLNNDIGVPLTLARLDANHRRLVVEMGANHAGEIAALAAVARPRVGVITLIAPAHLEGFGSIEGVARAKGELISALPGDGIAVVNGDDTQYLELWRDLAGTRRLLQFGLNEGADVRAVYPADPTSNQIRIETPTGTLEFTLRLAGRHNAANAAAAAAAALAMGVSLECVAAGLEGMQRCRCWPKRRHRAGSPSGIWLNSAMIPRIFIMRPDSWRGAWASSVC
jgi:UDP-N-acetylmuramoyl-tripeptide--D-alanyl-D-alanine ligase